MVDMVDITMDMVDITMDIVQTIITVMDIGLPFIIMEIMELDIHIINQVSELMFGDNFDLTLREFII
jgi:hypothetical protein